MLNGMPSNWMDILPVDVDKLTLNELRNFKNFHSLFTEKMTGPKGWCDYMRKFKFLQFFAIASIEENKYPALTKCWREMEAKFFSDEIFDDYLFIPSWIYFDFPLDSKGTTLLDEFEIFLKEEKRLEDFELFINEMKKSRLGLYQEVMSTKKVTKFKELITGKVISTTRSVPDYGNGEIFLTRIVEYKGEFFQFGDPKCWPSDYKNQIQDMVLNKLFYFEGDEFSEKENYKRFMKLAGPYWFSCVCTNEEIDILDPDHFYSYWKGKVKNVELYQRNKGLCKRVMDNISGLL